MLVITGANGRLGRGIAQALVERGLQDMIRLATRDLAAVHDLVELGFATVRADFSDPPSMDAAFKGATRVLLISATGPTPERILLHRNAIDAVRRAQVERLVYTSRVSPSDTSRYPFAPIHADSERCIRAAGIAHVILRNNEYAENMDSWIYAALKSGRFEFGAVGPVAYICRRDVIECAITALTSVSVEREVYEVSGPQALDRRQVARVLSETTGRAIEPTSGGGDEFAQRLAEQGRPDFVVEMGRGMAAASEAGEWRATSNDPAELTGVPATPIETYLRTKFAQRPENATGS